MRENRKSHSRLGEKAEERKMGGEGGEDEAGREISRGMKLNSRMGRAETENTHKPSPS